MTKKKKKSTNYHRQFHSQSYLLMLKEKKELVWILLK